MKLAPQTPISVALQWQDDDIVPVGRLAISARQTFFQYDPAFVSAALPISPFRLGVAPHVLGPFDTPFENLPGVFNDSLPDGWGRWLIDRRARELGFTLTPLDRLAITGRHGIGALVYTPETKLAGDSGALDLDLLAADAAATLEGGASDVLDRLIVLGGSPQGARPKAMIGWDSRNHSVIHGARDLPPGYHGFLVKFPAANDPPDIGPIEFAYARMAQAAGLRVPPAQLFPSRHGPGYFGSERFDRQNNWRVHVHTLSGLLHSDHRLPVLDYTTALAATRHLTRDHREVLAMFRTMAFNVLAHNRDDHAKQFSFLMDRAGHWRMAPAYDLTWSTGINGEHTTTIDGAGLAPNDADMLRVAAKCGIKKKEAAEIIDVVRASVARWPSFASEAGISKASAGEIARSLKAARSA